MLPEADAARRGDIESLRTRTSSPLQDDHGWVLRAAVDADSSEVLAALLPLGLDPDARVEFPNGEASWGMFLRRGDDPNGQVYASGTPLSGAYGHRDETMIELLIAYGGRPNASMAGLYRRMDLALHLLEEHGDAYLPDDGFKQLLGAAAKGGNVEILKLAMGHVSIPGGDVLWHGPLRAPLAFWNHWYGPWCHLEWDRGGYLACFELILEKSGPALPVYPDGLTILDAIERMGDHLSEEERAAFRAAAIRTQRGERE